MRSLKNIFLILSLYVSNTNGDARYKCTVCDPMGDREWPYSCSQMEGSTTHAHLKCKGNGCQYITKAQVKAGDLGAGDWCTYRNFTAPASSSTYIPLPECALITRGNGDAGTSRCEKKTATDATTIPGGVSSRKLTISCCGTQHNKIRCGANTPLNNNACSSSLHRGPCTSKLRGTAGACNCPEMVPKAIRS